MAGFKARIAMLVCFVSIFLLSLTSFKIYGYRSRRKLRSDENNFAFRANLSTKSANHPSKNYVDTVLLNYQNSEGVNCSRIASLCEDEQLTTYKHTYDIIKQDITDFRRVVLIVTLNKPHFEAIPKLHRLYGNIFSKVFYCVPSIHKCPTLLQPLVNISIVEYTKEPTEPTGSNFYSCLPIVLELISDSLLAETRGLLTISDDLIPNLWHFRRNREQSDILDNKMWLLNQQMDMFDVDSLRFCRGVSLNNEIDCNINGTRTWKVQQDNQLKLQNFFDDAETLFPTFVKQLSDASRGKRRIFNNYADLFYLSSNFFEQAYEIFKLFGKHGVYMEFAVGSAFRGITSDPEHVIDFVDRSGQLGPEEAHLLPSDMYDAHRPIYHPFKLGRLDDQAFTEHCLYCSIASMFEKYSLLQQQMP